METGPNILISRIGDIIMIELCVFYKFLCIFLIGKKGPIGDRRYI